MGLDIGGQSVNSRHNIKLPSVGLTGRRRDVVSAQNVSTVNSVTLHNRNIIGDGGQITLLGPSW